VEDFEKIKAEDKKEMPHTDVAWLIKERGILNPNDAINIVLEYVEKDKLLEAFYNKYKDEIIDMVLIDCKNMLHKNIEEGLQERDWIERPDYVGRCNWSVDQRRKVKEFLSGYLDDCGLLNH
jgi:hypothetical protein